MIIINIGVDKLVPHPKNPRQELGDITELTESIRVNGIRQNLTVIPFTGAGERYTVIIGHRRLAAAKKAGLTEVPCVVTEMDEKEQIATMLLENMQRTDLTIYEQSQGVQMMFDLGISVGEIAQQTGFSRSTVERRLKFASLGDKGKDPQISFEDVVKAHKVKDKEKRQEVLEYIGTSNFNWVLNCALDDQDWMERRKKLLRGYAAYAVAANWRKT